MARKNSRRGSPKENLQQNENFWSNNAWFSLYLDWLTEMALNRYEWVGLPNTCDPRYLELMLMMNGFAIFIKEEDVGVLSLGGTLTGELDVYGIPTWRNAIGANGFNFERDRKNSVICWNNYLHKGYYNILSMYAQRLAMCTQIANINVNVQSTPAIIVCDEKDKLSLQNLFLQYDGKSPLIKGYKGLSLDDFKVLSLNAPFVADKIETERRNIFNEVMTYIGINNVNQEKKERLVSPEANGNYEQVLMSRESGLASRKKACLELKEIFGIEVDVLFNEKIEKMYNVVIGGDNVEQIHNDSGTID